MSSPPQPPAVQHDQILETTKRQSVSSSPKPNYDEDAAWPGPVEVDPGDVFVPSLVYEKLVEMNGAKGDPVEARTGIALVPPHWRILKWSTEKDACVCCGIVKAKWQCSLGYCSERCHLSHADFHQCDSDSPNAVSLLPYRRRPVGLNNLGNTCFINAPVQCLMHVKPLTRYFLRESHLLDQVSPQGGNFSKVWASLCRFLMYEFSAFLLF